MAPVLNLVAQAKGLRTRDGDYRLEYDPRTFKGSAQLAQVMQPPGYDSLPPDVEYMLKFDNVGVENGELKGRAAEYWRGSEDRSANLGPNVGHGVHDNYLKGGNGSPNPGASPQDVANFRQRVAGDPGAMMLPVRHAGGLTSVLMPKAVMDQTNYKAKAVNRGSDPAGNYLSEAYFADSGQASLDEATALKVAARARYQEQNANRRR